MLEYLKRTAHNNPFTRDMSVIALNKPTKEWLNPKLKLNLMTLLLGMFFVAGCATGPVSTPHSAQSVGKNNVMGHSGLSPLSFGVDYGLFENFDIGAAVETQMQGDHGVNVMAKYCIINQPLGSSLAFTGGVFSGSHETGFNMQGSSIGSIYSYSLEDYEFFTSVRKNYATWTSNKENAADQFIEVYGNSSGFDPFSAKNDVEYSQVHIGFNYKRSETETFTLGVMCEQIFNEQECVPLISMTMSNYWERLANRLWKLFNAPAEALSEDIEPIRRLFIPKSETF